MNVYEEKQAAKRKHYQELAETTSKQSDSILTQARQMSDGIPLGQPILVGHYSEKRDRNYRSKIDGKYEKSFELAKRAKLLEEKAAAVGTGGVSSHDPAAIAKLTLQIETLKEKQARMKMINNALRKNNLEQTEKEQWAKVHCNQSEQKDLQLNQLYSAGYYYPAWALTNNAACIRNVTKRIEQLQKNAQRQAVAPFTLQTGVPEVKCFEQENRICFDFPEKPEQSVRTILAQNAFLWSPSRLLYVRKSSPNAIYAAQRIVQALQEANGEKNP